MKEKEVLVDLKVAEEKEGTIDSWKETKVEDDLRQRISLLEKKIVQCLNLCMMVFTMPGQNEHLVCLSNDPYLLIKTTY